MDTEATQGERIIAGRHIDWMLIDDGDGAIGVWMDEGAIPIGRIEGDAESGFIAEAFFGGAGFSARTATFDEAVQALYDNETTKQEG